MNKPVKITVIAVWFMFTLILIAGVIKFNFTNDDIFIETENWEIIQYDSTK